jgi:hypothetical protein
LAYSTLHIHQVLDARDQGAIAVREVGLRQWPDKGAELAVTDPLLEGTEVSVLSRKSGWVKVRAGGRYEGWLPDSSIATW